jgi:glycosyltransferase involved in cell wall biosynthesis
MKKNILYIGGGLPDKNASGIRVFSNALALKDAGYNVTALSLDRNCPNTIWSDEGGIRTCHKPMPEGNLEWVKYLYELKLYTEFWESIGKPEIIITYEQPAFSFLRLLRFCHKHNVKLVLDVTEWLTANHLSGVKKLIKQIEIVAEMRYAYKKADAFIVIGSFLKKYFERPDKPALMLPTLHSKAPAINNTCMQINKTRRFIYAGQMGADKDDLFSIIYALNGLRGFVFNIFGITKEEYIEAYSSHSSLLKDYEKEIIFNGRVLHQIVIDEQIKADYSFIIRRGTRRNNAGFPTKFGESIMYGTPVIATDFSDIRKYIETFHVGYVISSFELLHDSFVNILAKPDDELLQLKKNCLGCKYFDYSSHVEELDSFLKSILN